MIQTSPVPGRPDLIRTYSDIGMKIQQNITGNIYDEAIDPIFTHRTYTETDILIEKLNTEEVNPDEEILIEEINNS